MIETVGPLCQVVVTLNLRIVLQQIMMTQVLRKLNFKHLVNTPGL